MYAPWIDTARGVRRLTITVEYDDGGGFELNIRRPKTARLRDAHIEDIMGPATGRFTLDVSWARSEQTGIVATVR
jgi:hypothetical protein